MKLPNYAGPTVVHIEFSKVLFLLLIFFLRFQKVLIKDIEKKSKISLESNL